MYVFVPDIALLPKLFAHQKGKLWERLRQRHQALFERNLA